ncbi:DUF1120 domain-containing protein [Salmonella enterica]|nr:DUF1120 domain-containing protein [Salmonella enterica]EGW2852191.1 DUF1120 domain-containing protein [Salmonella enterica]
MKILFPLLFFTFVSAITPAVFAAESADLTVTGNVTVGSCDLNLSSSTVDFGNISIEAMMNGVFTPPQKQTMLTVSCSEAMTPQLTMTDNRVSSLDLDNDGIPASTAGAGFGLGFTDSSNTTAIGYMHIGMGVDADTGAELGTTIDSNPGQTIYRSNSNNDWQTGTGPVRGNAHVHFAWQPKGQSTPAPVAFNTVKMPLSIWLHLNSADVLKLNTDTKIDGSVTLSLVYL